MKKIISFLLTFCLLAAFFIPAYAEDEQTKIHSGDYTYILLEDGTAEITKYSGKEKNLSIPSELDGFTVTSIGNSAFAECRELVWLTIPDSITTIGNWAFYCCFHLSCVIIPDSVTTIGIEAFRACSSMTSLVIPESVTEIGNGICMESNVCTIILKPDSYAEQYCNDPDHAFGSDVYTYYDTYGNNTFCFQCGEQISADSKYCRYCGYNTAHTMRENPVEYTSDSYRYSLLDDGTVEIRKFLGEANLAERKAVSIPSVLDGKKVTSIGSLAFEYYYDTDYEFYNYYDSYTLKELIEEVTIPDTVTAIGSYAFAGCESLKKAVIPDSVTAIGICAFHGCSGLETITLPRYLVSIGAGAFSYCWSLEAVDIPDSVAFIGKGAFCGCPALTDFTIPYGITAIRPKTFAYCYSLDNVTLPDSVTSIDAAAFNMCGLESITIPNSVTSIGDYAFRDYSLDSRGISKEFTLPASISFIGKNAFDCYGLELSSLSFTVVEGSYAEQYCKDNGLSYRY